MEKYHKDILQEGIQKKMMLNQIQLNLISSKKMDFEELRPDMKQKCPCPSVGDQGCPFTYICTLFSGRVRVSQINNTM